VPHAVPIRMRCFITAATLSGWIESSIAQANSVVDCLYCPAETKPYTLKDTVAPDYTGNTNIAFGGLPYQMARIVEMGGAQAGCAKNCRIDESYTICGLGWQRDHIGLDATGHIQR
jgi:hypothetical protein